MLYISADTHMDTPDNNVVKQVTIKDLKVNPSAAV